MEASEAHLYKGVIAALYLTDMGLRDEPMNWQHRFRSEGYSLFPGLVSSALVDHALEAIAGDLEANYDERRRVEYDNRSYCPDLHGTPPITNLIVQSPVREILDEALGLDRVSCDGGQVAIRKSNDRLAPTPPEPHLDGFATGLNGLLSGRIYSHTLLVGVFLTPVQNSFAGNFTVWPRSHLVFENYFRERGQRALKEPMPKPPLGEPLQLACNAGDVVFAHYLLGHAAAINTSGTDRVAIFFRVSLHDLERDRWKHLTNAWEGWKI